MRVLWWASGNDGSNHYRMILPAMAVQWQGHQCRVTTRITQADVEECDALVISRPTTPDAHNVIAAAQRAGKRVIADLDDNYWEIDPSNAFAHRWWKGERQQGLSIGIEMADIAVAASRQLATVMRDQSGRETVEVVPNGLHAQWLSYPRKYDNDEIVLGWAGTQNTLAWLGQVADAVNAALAKHENMKFLAVGADLPELAQAGIALTEKVFAAGNVNPHDNYMQAVANFDIWLAPYSSTPFTEAKFPTKALEAGFLGIPLIASDIGPYREWMGKNGQYGFVVTQDYQWTRAIDTYARMPETRKWVGENARSHACPNIMQQLGFDWCNILEGNTK